MAEKKKRYQSQRIASERYNLKHQRVYSVKAYDTKDADLIAWLDAKESVSGYVKDLVRADMERSRGYWYGMRLREFGIGCQPSGVVEHINGDGRTLGDGKYWSYIKYDEPLTAAQQRAYDLTAVSAEEARKESK